MFGSSRSGGQGDEFQYRGVQRRSDNRYRAVIKGVEEKGKKNHLGTFDTAEEAAMAYDYAARSLHGSKAYTNFVYPDGRQRGSLTNIPAPEEPEYELSPQHPPAPAAGYNYQQGYYGQGQGQASGFGQVEYPQWVPGDELPPLPQELGSTSAVGYGGGYMAPPPPGPGSSYSGYGYGYGNGNGW
ncbi:hypothetical protein SASPL_105299 [Salvia splendens]|uniref:AP2/ERF domain-containing protein n=1 Tax=Salvia splendens TaxID=180675 RepID=A0A4D8ZZP3_SALSN|nr:ethylene-responsive transcription factor LEP-like [Salvia splendens]XP_042030373.1 ethylene-responsive transcription factor LEP-like [Salvia splendens]XP_042030390.1 ethylene-responsive transcription factor LEP-like [Salvia splendens]XP_042030422.1 ethylene-responsive transcription factor LEP-like [Salvia splendens]KAG6433679.1 hypothetical protein SASPL_105294 [Salvia splendens]KAG6433680.1 hypothetical protein SASPL_105295 [Salvia splendens]KAG6433681.1 hypothetical protein SASPL_105296 